MEDILFDSRSGLDKLPFGAVSAGTAVNFGIRTAEALNISWMKIVVRADPDGSEREYALVRVWCERGYTRFEGRIDFEESGLCWYYFKALSSDGWRLIGKSGGGADFVSGEPRLWQQTVYATDYITPEWISGGAFYHIFVDRFCKAGERPVRTGALLRGDWGGTPHYRPDADGEIRNNDFFGGNLDGIIEKLPYLSSLGISCLYLSPVFEAASNHKYDTADYLRIDPSFGDEESFKTLCAKAGKLGIRVICDGVFNHTGSDSVYFNRNGTYGGSGAYRSKDSEFFEWYNFTRWPDEYDAWWGVKTLPQINKECAGFRGFITGENGVLQKWMNYGACGWRLDVADELSENFLRELRRRVKSENSEALIIGEVWEDASSKISYGSRRHYFEGAELDSVMNYPFREAIIAYLLNGRAEELRETVESVCENYPKPALDCLMNILGTHDTERILTVLGGKTYAGRDERANAVLSEGDRAHAKSLLRSASLLQFTLPGVPCIYYGDEAGLEGYEDPFNRRCYPWGNEDPELIEWYRTLLRVRKGSEVLAGGEYRTLRAWNGVFSFERSRGGHRTQTLINLGQDAVSVVLSENDAIPVVWNCEKNENSLRVLHEGCVFIETAEA